MKPSTDLRRTPKASPRSVNAAAFAILLAVVLISLCFGSYPLWFTLPPEQHDTALRVFLELRVTRVLAGLLAGGVLGVTGAVCQTVFCNPLASPDITGVASGASFGAASAILLGLSGLARAGFAFLGGTAALVLLLLLVRLSGAARAEQKSRYLLAGILISSAADAGLMVLKTAADPERELAAIEFWTMGSFASMTSQKLTVMTLASVPPLVLLFIFSNQSLILSRGREEALSVGVSPAVWQTVLLALITWSVAGTVSSVGVIGFIGLIVPHIALAVSHSRGKGFLPLCFAIGAVLTVLSDLFARTAVPGAELPVSIFSVGFAVVWFAWLFCRGRVMGGNDPC